MLFSSLFLSGESSYFHSYNIRKNTKAPIIETFLKECEVRKKERWIQTGFQWSPCERFLLPLLIFTLLNYARGRWVLEIWRQGILSGTPGWYSLRPLPFPVRMWFLLETDEFIQKPTVPSVCKHSFKWKKTEGEWKGSPE